MEISIIALPLIASIISGFFGKFIGDRNSEIITSLLVSISAILSALVLYEVIVNQYQDNITIATWISSGSLNVNWSMKIDALSAVMLVVVTSVSALVHIYSLNLSLMELFTDKIQSGVINVVSKINKIEIPSTPTL